jgi:predicted exporter
MENETLLQLGDSIRDEIGQAESKQFIESSAPAIQTALENLKTTREALSSAVGVLAGEETAGEMLGAEPEEGGATDMAEPAADAGAEVAPADDFATAEPAAGGIETAGREQRESINYESRLLKTLAG